MACCIVGALLISQLMLAWNQVSRFFRDAAPLTSAAEWSPAAEATTLPTIRRAASKSYRFELTLLLCLSGLFGLAVALGLQHQYGALRQGGGAHELIGSQGSSREGQFCAVR